MPRDPTWGGNSMQNALTKTFIAPDRAKILISEGTSLVDLAQTNREHPDAARIS